MSEQLTLLQETAPKAAKTIEELVPSEGAAVESQEAAPLSNEERCHLQEHEEIIGTGLGQFLIVGQALSEINRSRLYREGFKTFTEYCKVRWNLGSDYAYRLMQSADCVERLKEAAQSKGYTVLPSNESQVRPLTRLKKLNRQVTAWKRAAKEANGNNVTAEVVEQVVNGMLGKTSMKGSAQSTKKGAEHQLKSIGKLVSKELEKSKDLKPNLKKLLKRILELTGMQEKSAK